MHSSFVFLSIHRTKRKKKKTKKRSETSVSELFMRLSIISSKTRTHQKKKKKNTLHSVERILLYHSREFSLVSRREQGSVG